MFGLSYTANKVFLDKSNLWERNTADIREKITMAIKKYEGIVTIEIDEDKCNGDGECVNVCPTSVFELIEGKSHATKVDECIECCACVEACPTKAIKHSSC